jgi:hypothetical protein
MRLNLIFDMSQNSRLIFSEIKALRRNIFAFFFITAVVAVLTPHFFRGSFFISENYEQSLVIATDGLVTFMFYRAYRRKVDMLIEKHVEIESNLDESYAHIGKVNTQLDLIKEFIVIPSGVSFDKKEEKRVFTKMLSYLLLSVAKSKIGLIRFIDIENGKTLKEYHIFNENFHFSPKLSNNAIAQGDYHEAVEEGVEIFGSYYKDSKIRCVLSFPKTENKFDENLIKLLLTQMHLLYLATHSEGSLNGGGDRCYV